MEDESLLKVDKELKTSEKVSLVFLLCKSSTNGVTIIEQLCQHDDGIFSSWLRNEGLYKNNKWDNSFIEALTVIQNYKIGKDFGFKKEELQAKYLPSQILKTVYLCRLKKGLYRLCESLTALESKELVEGIEKDSIKITRNPIEYLEYYILLWDTHNVIGVQKSSANLDLLFKNISKFDVNHLLNDLKLASLEFSKNVLTISSVNSTEFYDIIDENELGYCIIMNEKHFHKSTVPEYKPLLPNEDLQPRIGSDKDVEKLEKVMKAFGFVVKVYNDVEYKEFFHVLEYYTTQVLKSHSFFILVILSHGSENVIYTSDSVPVSIDTIELIFQGRNCPNLISKPKIFIVQSCQGTEWQQIQSDTAKVTVEPKLGLISKVTGPERGDSIIAWSTVKGFASFRHRNYGSWFIQEFCDTLWKDGETHDLVDIFTSVNNTLRSKTYQGQFMVPWLSLSLCKKVKFPRKKENCDNEKIIE